jgi:hypothetical protein
MLERVQINGNYAANYCSKQCEMMDLNKGAIVKNQDAIYRQAALRKQSRSKSPIAISRIKRNLSPRNMYAEE